MPCLRAAKRHRPRWDRSYSSTIIRQDVFGAAQPARASDKGSLEAAEQLVSMNHWVVQKLSGWQLSDTFGLSGFDWRPAESLQRLYSALLCIALQILHRGGVVFGEADL